MVVSTQDRIEAWRALPEGGVARVDAPESFRYRAFISYSHEDEARARWLHKALETWRPPRHLIGKQTDVGVVPGSLAPVFRDRDELASSANLNQQVHQALEQSACLVVICSPAAARSRWVNEEIRAFQRLGRSDRVFCLIVDGEPGTANAQSGNDTECFVPALHHSSPIGPCAATSHGEPIAADLRPGGDGKRLALLKLVSGMLGLGLDELRMREHQRRVRRLSLITALAVLTMLVTTTLAIVALMARDSAQIQQSQAEGLVSFMLNDLGSKLQDTNRLDTLQAVNNRAMAYYKSLPSRDVNESVLAGRAAALQRIGSVRVNQGHLGQALESFNAAEQITAALLAQQPAQPGRMADEAENLLWIGKTFWYQGELDQALTPFRKASALLKHAGEYADARSETASKLAQTQTNIGRILERRGDLVGAEPEYRAVLETYRQLHERYPDNNVWYSELGFAYNNLGKLVWQRGQLASSVAYYQVDLDIKLHLANRDPGKRQWQWDLALTRAMLGNALLGTGDLDTAETEYRQAARAGGEIVAFDPDNMTNVDMYAIYTMLLGQALRIQGNLPQAASHLDKARGLLTDLATRYPDNVVFREDLTRALLESARLEIAQGHRDQAMRFTTTAEAMARELLGDNSADIKATLLLAQTLLERAPDPGASDSPQSASQGLTEARSLVEPLARSSNNPDILALWARILSMRGENGAADQVTARLHAMGYRNPDFLMRTARHGVASKLGLESPTPATPDPLKPSIKRRIE